MTGALDAGVLLAVLWHLGRFVLHGGVHTTEQPSVVQVEYVAGGLAFFVLAGGLLVWYYERLSG